MTDTTKPLARKEVTPILKGSAKPATKVAKPSPAGKATVTDIASKRKANTGPKAAADRKAKARVAKTQQQAKAKAAAKNAARKAKAGAKVVRAPSTLSKTGTATCGVCKQRLPIVKFPSVRVNGEQVRDTRRCRDCQHAGEALPAAVAKRATKAPAKAARKIAKAPAAKRTAKSPRKAAAKAKG